MDIENSNSNAVSTIGIDATVGNAVLFGELYDDSVSGQGKSFVLSLQKLVCALCSTFSYQH